MRPTRRQLLAGLTAIAACDTRSDAVPAPRSTTATPTTLPAPGGGNVWRPPGLLDEAAFSGGLRCGDPGADTLRIAGFTTEPEALLVGVMAVDGRWEPVPTARARVGDGGCARVDVTGLSPDTDHAFVLLSADGQRRSDVGRFRTAPVGERAVRLGASSCFGNANPSLPSLGVAAGDDLDAFLLCGDAIYTRATTLDGYRDEWARLARKEHFRALASVTPLIAVWDDHEVANNWIVGPPGPNGAAVEVEPEQVEVALAALDEFIPRADGPIWRTVRFGDLLEVIVLDARGERTPDRIVSDEQLDWATQALRASACRFKVVVTSVHVTDHAGRLSPRNSDRDWYDRWQGYPEQRRVLLEAAEAVGDVVFVSGDIHFGAILRVGAAGDLGADLYEISAGPAGSAPWDAEGWMDTLGADKSQYDALIDGWSYARLVADPVAGLSVALIGDDGEVLAERVLIA